MEHSKLPWRVNGPQIECDGHPRLVTKCENMFMEDAEIHANSHFIVTACNEHDTLKAKADLFDELVSWGANYDESSVGNIMIELAFLVQKFTDKAKELTK
jgi:hypothetical protein